MATKLYFFKKNFKNISMIIELVTIETQGWNFCSYTDTVMAQNSHSYLERHREIYSPSYRNFYKPFIISRFL